MLEKQDTFIDKCLKSLIFGVVFAWPFSVTLLIVKFLDVNYPDVLKDIGITLMFVAATAAGLSLVKRLK